MRQVGQHPPCDRSVDLLGDKFADGGEANSGSDFKRQQADFRAWTSMLTSWLAMLEKVTFSVGSNDIESITGEQLQIMNELMTSDEMRLGYKTTSRPEARRLLINIKPLLQINSSKPCELGDSMMSCKLTSSKESKLVLRSTFHTHTGRHGVKTSYKKLLFRSSVLHQARVAVLLLRLSQGNDVRITTSCVQSTAYQVAGFVGASGKNVDVPSKIKSSGVPSYVPLCACDCPDAAAHEQGARSSSSCSSTTHLQGG